MMKEKLVQMSGRGGGGGYGCGGGRMDAPICFGLDCGTPFYSIRGIPSSVYILIISLSGRQSGSSDDRGVQVVLKDRTAF